MSAIPLPPPDETPEQRRARHLRMCQELAELALAGARGAAHKALADLAGEAQGGLPATEEADWEDDEAEEDDEPTEFEAAADLFIRFATMGRLAITLEAELDEEAITNTAAPPPDPEPPSVPQIVH